MTDGYFILFVVMPIGLWDFAYYKVPNVWILLGLGMGCYQNYLTGGFKGVGMGLSVGFLPILFGFIFSRLRMIGAGDLKFFSVIGCYYGLSFMGRVALYTLFLGGLAGLIRECKNRTLLLRFRNLYDYAKETIRSGRIKTYETGGYIPLGTCMAAATLLNLGGESLKGWML